MSTISVLTCPVCGAPFSPGTDQCGYCGSVVVIQTDHARVDAASLNKSVINEHIARYRQAIRKDRSDATAHYGLGVAYFNLGLLEESSDELLQAVKLMPENANIQTQLAVVLSKRAPNAGPAVLKQSWERLERALLLNPRNVDALMLKAHLLQQQAGSAATNSDLINLQQRMVSTWREIAAIDPERVRTDVTGYVRANQGLVPKTNALAQPKLPNRIDAAQSEFGRRPWLLKTIALSIGALFLAMIVTIILIMLLGEDETGSVDTSGFLGVLSMVSLLAWPIAPIVVFIRRFRRSRQVDPKTGSNLGGKEGIEPPSPSDGKLSIHQLAYAQDVSVDRLINAANFLVDVQRQTLLTPLPVGTSSVKAAR